MTVVGLGFDVFALTFGFATFRFTIAISMMDGLGGCFDFDMDESTGLFNQVG